MDHVNITGTQIVWEQDGEVIRTEKVTKRGCHDKGTCNWLASQRVEERFEVVDIDQWNRWCLELTGKFIKAEEEFRNEGIALGFAKDEVGANLPYTGNVRFDWDDPRVLELYEDCIYRFVGTIPANIVELRNWSWDLEEVKTLKLGESGNAADELILWDMWNCGEFEARSTWEWSAPKNWILPKWMLALNTGCGLFLNQKLDTFADTDHFLTDVWNLDKKTNICDICQRGRREEENFKQFRKFGETSWKQDYEMCPECVDKYWVSCGECSRGLALSNGAIFHCVQDLKRGLTCKRVNNKDL